jgi:hypothetical protein
VKNEKPKTSAKYRIDFRDFGFSQVSITAQPPASNEPNGQRRCKISIVPDETPPPLIEVSAGSDSAKRRCRPMLRVRDVPKVERLKRQG